MNRNCYKCNQSFHCDSKCDSHCWCIDYPAISHFDDSASCLCTHCLPKHIASKLEDFIEFNSTNDVIRFAKQYEEKKPIEHIDYTTKNGNIIFTKWFHLKRGDCCKNDCVNCPF